MSLTSRISDFYHIYSLQHHLKRREVRDVRAAHARNLFVNKNTADSAGWLVKIRIMMFGFESLYSAPKAVHAKINV